MVLRNGVDTAAFHPVDRASRRSALGFTGPTLLSVGHLIERKGHHRVIEAMALLPGMRLAILGEGPERARLAALIASLGLSDRVQLLGARPHGELSGWYGAADALVLASSREGWANVLLEAMACGTPVVASNIWGNPEVVQTRDAGLIMQRTRRTASRRACGTCWQTRRTVRPPAPMPSALAGRNQRGPAHPVPAHRG